MDRYGNLVLLVLSEELISFFGRVQPLCGLLDVKSKSRSCSSRSRQRFMKVLVGMKDLECVCATIRQYNVISSITWNEMHFSKRAM